MAHACEPQERDMAFVGGCRLHAVKNDAVDFLAIVPSPPQSIFQLHKFSSGGEG